MVLKFGMERVATVCVLVCLCICGSEVRHGLYLVPFTGQFRSQMKTGFLTSDLELREKEEEANLRFYIC